MFVQIPDAQHHFRTIKPCAIFGEPVRLFLTSSIQPHELEVAEQRTARQKWHAEIEFVFRLECELQVAQEGVVCLLQNGAFTLRVFDLVARDDLRLLEDLESVDAAVAFVADEENLAERAATDHAKELEIVF